MTINVIVIFIMASNSFPATRLSVLQELPHLNFFDHLIRWVLLSFLSAQELVLELVKKSLVVRTPNPDPGSGPQDFPAPGKCHSLDVRATRRRELAKSTGRKDVR